MERILIMAYTEDRIRKMFIRSVQGGATEKEALQALSLFFILKPGLRVKKNGRVDTLVGDKTPLGLHRVCERISKKFTAFESALPKELITLKNEFYGKPGKWKGSTKR